MPKLTRPRLPGWRTVQPGASAIHGAEDPAPEPAHDRPDSSPIDPPPRPYAKTDGLPVRRAPLVCMRTSAYHVRLTAKPDRQPTPASVNCAFRQLPFGNRCKQRGAIRDRLVIEVIQVVVQRRAVA